MSMRPADFIAGTHFNYLDGWRGVAISLLLVGHFFPVPGINFGAIGVNLFFVLSGMLMAGLLFEKNEPIKKFYRRRIARILPAHALFIAAIVMTHHFAELPFSFREVLSALLFVNNYMLPEGGAGTAKMPFGHIWSLSVEEHSYVVLSLVAIAARNHWISAKAGIGTLLIICVGSASYYQWLSPPNLAFVQWLHTEVAAYGLIGAAWWVTSGRSLGSRYSSVSTAPLLLLIGVLLHWWSIPLLVQRLFGVGCFVAAICMLSIHEGWFAKALAWLPLRQLGLWSYSLYLWQQPFYLWMHQDNTVPPILALALAVGCGLASFFLIERPARSYLNSHWGK